MSDILKPGANIVVYWEANKRSTTTGAVKSNRTSAGKSKKIILVAKEARGAQPQPAEVWVCRVERITSPKADSRGAIFVSPVCRQLDYKFDGVWIDPIKARLIAAILQDPRRNLMLEGDQGVGKSTIAHAIATTLGWEYRKISGGLIKKFVYMLGRFTPTEERDKPFAWADSKLVEVLREANANPGKTYLCMIDEYTRIDEDARDALLDVIEGKQRSMRLPSGEEVPVGKNVVFMGAGNVGQGFTIRAEDAAAKDRWAIVKIGVMPPAEEIAHCLKLYPTCPKQLLVQAIDAINAVRDARLESNMRLPKTVSTRGAETVAALLSAGFPLEVALETAVVNQYAGTAADEKSEAWRVSQRIEKTLSSKK